MNLLSKDFSNFELLKSLPMTATFVANVVIITTIIVVIGIIRDLTKK
tara:strand:+ start:437 stop:577 length:141 start_codon:yes stop_codon:yes gene_type:complete